MMKLILGTLTAVTLLAGVAASQPAEARCFWNGYATQCWHHPYWQHRHHYWGPHWGGYWRGY